MFLLPIIAVLACASYELVQLPVRDADLYPHAETSSGISVAATEISDPRRIERYFGVNLLEYEILPIQVVVSNHSDRRCLVSPSDVLALRGREVIDPLPIETVAVLLKERSTFLGEETSQQIDEFFSELAFQETVLAPRETYQGVLFFDAARRRTLMGRRFRLLAPFLQTTVKVHVAVTDLESRERLHYGPFGVYH